MMDDDMTDMEKLDRPLYAVMVAITRLIMLEKRTAAELGNSNRWADLDKIEKEFEEALGDNK